MIRVAGLLVTEESLAELQASLDRITQAENEAWNSMGVIR